MELTTLRRQLIETVGAEYVSEDPASCAAYAIDGYAPGLVVAPGSVAELARVMAAAHAARAAVAPWGGGTRQRMGKRLELRDWPAGQGAAPPLLVIRTGRLSSVIAYEPDDLTIAVEAGITMAALAETLARNGQMLPVDTPLPERDTLGGVLATAADGPRRLGYGTLRDLLIGIQVVEAGGRVSKAGGMVVKNVSGFDMMKLYLGSLGSLAIIASANFKLIPRPRAAATLWCSFPDQARAFALVEAIHSSQLTPVAVEYVEEQKTKNREHPSPIADLCSLFSVPCSPGVAVLAEGHPAAVERHLRDGQRLAAQAGATATRVLEGGEHTALWARIADLPQTAEVAADELVLRLSCLPGELARALGEAAELAGRYGLALQVAARALSGVAYLRARGAALAAWHASIYARWPQLVVLACPPPLKAEMPIWGQLPAGVEIMQGIKAEFDPEGVLNPGRFVV